MCSFLVSLLESSFVMRSKFGGLHGCLRKCGIMVCTNRWLGTKCLISDEYGSLLSQGRRLSARSVAWRQRKAKSVRTLPPSCLHSGAVWPWCHLWGWFPRLRKREDVSNSVCPLSVETLPLNYFQMCSLIVPRNLQVLYVLCLITNHSSKISGVKSEYFL